MKLLKALKIFIKTGVLKREPLNSSQLGFKGQEMLANPVWKTPHVWKARSQQHRSAVPNSIMSNILSIQSLEDIAKAVNTHICSTLINENVLYSKIALMLASVSSSSISFDVASIMTVMKCAKPSYRPGNHGIQPVRFLFVGQGFPLHSLDLFSLSMYRATYLSQW